MKGMSLLFAGCLLGLAGMPLPAVAGVDGWVHQCRLDNSRNWCDQAGRKLAAGGHAEAAAAFNINSGFNRLFAVEYGTVSAGGSRLRTAAAAPRATRGFTPADQERVRTPEGLRQYLFERAGKGNARADFLYAGASKGAERVQWMQQSAAAGDADAMYVLGYMYANGLDGLKRDDAQAWQWTSRAAQAGNAAAMGVQARMQAARAGSAMAAGEALRLAGKACDKGAQSACIALADLKLAALAGKPDEGGVEVGEALQLYANVLLKESTGFTLEPERQAALYSLAKLYVDGRYLPPNKVEARDDLVRALNVDGAMITDAWLTYADEVIAGPDGEYGFARETAKGMEILRRFADMGDVSATLVLGTLLLGGHEGVPADTLAARGLLKKAAAGGDTLAMTRLARHYSDEKNEPEAFRWVQQAVAAGDPRALYLAAGHYRGGRGTDKDENAFRNALRKSCEMDYLRACVEVGSRLLTGADGFPVDVDAGSALLEKARSEGSADASFALGTHKLRTSSFDNEAQLRAAAALLLEAGKRGSKEAEESLARIAGGDNVILKNALALAKGEKVMKQLSVEEEMMRQLR